MSEQDKPRRKVVPGGIAVLGSAAALAVGSATYADTTLEGTGDTFHMAQASQAAGGEGEGEGASAGGEGEGSSGGEGASAGGEGEASSGGEGEGEGASAGGEGEGSIGVEGEGEGASAGGEGEGEGEGEGGGSDVDPEVALLRDLGFMTGHLRAGLALYEAGDLEAARTHIGHPIEEKYQAVADTLDERGFENLRDQMTRLIEAAEGGADHSEIEAAFNEIIATVDQVREDSDATPAMRLTALAELGLIAAEEYDVAIADDGSIANLHEYQDSWGFLRTIERQATSLAESGDETIRSSAEEILAQVEAAGEAYGTLQGEDIPSADPSIVFGAAARMELAALRAAS
jgi:hypothetical protein